MGMAIYSLVAILVFGGTSHCIARTPGEQLYADLERHLQSTKSLELKYSASGTALTDGPLVGRMVFLRPAQFLHETPEWTLCESGADEWRYLKAQNTLILERVVEREDWSPEAMLLNLRTELRAKDLTKREDGTRILYLASDDASAPQTIVLEFARNALVPNVLRFEQIDGTSAVYQIDEWTENQEIDDALFLPPEVPDENRIDFRFDKSDR